MRRLGVVLLLLLLGCFRPIHEARAQEVAASMRPGCGDVRAEMAADDGWLWKADACGTEYGCGYDARGVMRCARWPSRPITDADLIRAADPSRMCAVFGHPTGDDVWLVEACGSSQRCRRRVGGEFECGPLAP